MGFTFLVGAILITLLVAAILFFIDDGIKAKSEGRKRNPMVTALFILAVGVLGQVIIGGILMIGLTIAVVTSM